MISGTTFALIAWGAIVGVFAGWVRGFAGFGFSAICVSGLVWFTSPETIVPVVLILEILATVFVWREARLNLDKTWLKTCILAGLGTVPLGAMALLWLPEETLKLTVSILLFVAALSVRFSIRARWPNAPTTRITCGSLMGVFNGISASGGIVGAMMMSASGMNPKALRATMAFMLLFSGTYTLFCLSVISIISGQSSSFWSTESWVWLGVLGLAMLVGLHFGGKKFKKTPSNDYRVFVLNLIMIISGIGIVRAFMTI
jgi:uncharacterized membrane protein YfcA